MEWFRKQRAYPFASVPADARRKAWLTIKKSNGALSPQDAGMGWSPVGPAPTDSGLPMGLSSGRINTIAISPADPNVLLIGSSAGGIWRSNDGGNTFIPVSDDQVDLEVGSIAFSQSDPNIVYAGMGDAFGGLLGTGVLKSVDAGQTWTRIDGGSVGQGMINALRVDPTNPNLVYSSHFDMLDETSGMLFGAGFEKSTDGGASWNRTLPGLPTDLAIDPLEPKKLYLAMVGVFDGSGRPPGIYQSLDSGNTWNLIRPFSFANGVSTAKIALAPSDPRTIYAYYGGFNPGLQVLFEVSTDGGATWASKDVSQVDSGQFGYNTYIGVDPADPGTVYLGSRDVYKTTDAGSTWKNLTVNFVPSPTNPGSWNFQPGQATSHSDQHAVAISPKNSNQVFISNDGGLWGSNDAGTTFQSLNRSLSLVQFYGVAAHPTDANLTFGGTQDNGSEKRAPGSNQWKQFITGDGGFCFVDPTDPNILFSTYVYGNVFRFTADGDNFDKTIGSNQVFGEPDSGQRIEFIAPFTCDGVHDVLYFGTWRLFTSHDRGDTWAAPGGTLDLTKGTSPNGPSDAINAIGVGPADPNIIYTGSGEGRVMVTKDGGVTWTDVTSSLPNRSVTSITVSGTDSNIAYLTFSGYVSGHVFQTTNAGASWTDISGNLPDIPVNALFAYPSDPNTLIVGTDIGIFGSTVGGNEWGSFNVGLPPVVVNAFTLRPNQNIVAATYGRGAYELPAGIKPPPPDFSISLSPASVSASRGSAAPVMVKIVRTGGFSPSVSVTPPNASSFGVKVKPAKALTGDSVSFTLKIKANAPVGTQQLNFTAQDSSGVSHSASLALTIQ